MSFIALQVSRRLSMVHGKSPESRSCNWASCISKYNACWCKELVCERIRILYGHSSSFIKDLLSFSCLLSAVHLVNVSSAFHPSSSCCFKTAHI